MIRDVKHLLERDDIRSEMGKRARNYAEKTHGFIDNKDKITKFFSMALNESKFKRKQ